MNASSPAPATEKLRSLRTAFFTGLILCLPLAITVYAVQFLVNLLGAPAKDFVLRPILRALAQDQFATDLIESAPGNFLVTILSALLAVLIILIVGYLAKNFIGRVIFEWIEAVLDRVPMVNKVYIAAKQMVDTFGNKADTFKEVVIVEYPRAGCRSVGFVANRTPAERWGRTDLAGEKLVHVFVPTAPNPTAGFILLLPESEVTPAGMTVAEGMKFIVSCGAMLPADENENAAH